MDNETLLTIGALAERTGLTVKAIRFYSDQGIVEPTERSHAGYRLYDADASARLELVRTLRELGIDLATIRRVLARETSIAEVAAAHADALDVHIRVLRLRRAVLRAVAERKTDPRETELMHRLAKMSAAERNRYIHDFVDDTFGRVDANPEVAELIRTTMPELPDEPDSSQVQAWMDLVELIGDEDFRTAVRRMAEYQAAERANGDTTGLHHELTEAVGDRVRGALADGIAPASPAAAEIVAGLSRRYAETFDRPDTPDLRSWILNRLEVANDPRVERYWQLVGTVNGWPTAPELGPVFTWFAAALRAGLA